MAQALSVDVIAEGVETERQLAALRELQCELAQGFFLHRPLTAQAISELLATAGDGSPGEARPRSRSSVAGSPGARL